MSYSNKTHVILIKDEIRTTDVTLVKDDDATGTIFVYFKRAQEEGRGRLYQYSREDVVVLKNPRVFNPGEHEVLYEGSPLDNVYIICGFSEKGLDYWTIGFQDSRADLVCPASKLKVICHRRPGERSSDVLLYLTQMAYLHGYDLRNGEDIVLLGDQYDHIRRGDSAPLLEAYLHPQGFQLPMHPVTDTPVYPFCTNASQMQAISRALQHRISVIQGPPGTGKTETILNLLLNLVLSGKSVLVVAGSNSAIENIEEKMQEEHLDFLVAALGRKSNKERFITDQKVENLCPDDWGSEDCDTLSSWIRAHSAEMESLFLKDRELHEVIEHGDTQKADELRSLLDRSEYQKKRDLFRVHSLAIVRRRLYDRFGGRYRRDTYALEDLGEESTRFEAFLRDYPIVLSTAFSATKCTARGSLYDYVIMDEASQISVATGALALSVARNAVIVGDVKQLPNVIKEEMKAVSQSVFSFFDIPEPYNYATHNFLQSVCEVFGGVPETLLREHYRCHPKIARFFNREFYGGQLVAMTEDKGEEHVLVLRTTVPGYHAADFTNHREEEEIEDILRKHDFCRDCSRVGIIAPYNNQVHRIEDDEDIEDDMMVATVHSFQGRQNDTIIISTVDNEYSGFVNNANLFNVAVSRARKHLILVTNGNGANSGTVQHLVDFILENGGTYEKGDRKSLFDLIYPQYEADYADFVAHHPSIPEKAYRGGAEATKAEIIAYGFITDVLKEFPGLAVWPWYPMKKLTSRLILESDEERNYVNEEGTHVDFLVYGTNPLRPVLAIEIDGSSYHVEGSFQSNRDKMKDAILARSGIPLKRFRTRESIDEIAQLHSLIISLNNQYDEIYSRKREG